MRRLGLVAVLLLAGCGGNGSDPTPRPTAAPTTVATATSRPELTHAAFVKKLDRICQGDINDLGKEAEAAGGDTEKLAGIVRSVAGRINAIRHRQEQIDAPAEDQAAYRRYLNAQRRMAAIFTRMGATLDDGDVSQTRYFMSLIDGVRAARTRAALDLGLERCGA